MRRLLSAILMAVFVLGSLPSAAWAEDVTKKVEELSGQAATAYGAGDYEKAIDLFKQAYALQPVPNLLFNIAKVYEKTENWDEAEKNYRDFIKSPDADSKAREVALERLDAIAEIKRAAAEANKPPEETDKPPVDEKPRDLPPPPPKKASIVPWIVMGGGVALVGGGVVFGILASGQQSKFDAAETADDKRTFRKNGKTFAAVADGMYGAGAIAGIVGVILLLTSGGSDSAPAQAQAIVPTGWVGPHGQAGVGLSLQF